MIGAVRAPFSTQSRSPRGGASWSPRARSAVYSRGRRGPGVTADTASESHAESLRVLRMNLDSSKHRRPAPIQRRNTEGRAELVCPSPTASPSNPRAKRSKCAIGRRNIIPSLGAPAPWLRGVPRLVAARLLELQRQAICECVPASAAGCRLRLRNANHGCLCFMSWFVDCQCGNDAAHWERAHMSAETGSQSFCVPSAAEALGASGCKKAVPRKEQY